MAKLTMLTEMMSADLPEAIDRLKALGITLLDLKGRVFDRSIENLDDPLRAKLAELLDQTGAQAYCFSSVLGHWDFEQMGEAEFRRRLDEGLTNLLATARCVRPQFIRLLGCKISDRAAVTDSNEQLDRNAAWVYAAYRDAVDRIAEAGVGATIENEPNCVLSYPAETVGFFHRLDRPGKVGFTWDVQNMWASGVFPTLEVYERLRPIINYVHLKGGRAGPDRPRELLWRAGLAEASWPVVEIVARVLADGASPVLCLNISHGKPADDDPLRALRGDGRALAAEEARRDVAFLREKFREIE